MTLNQQAHRESPAVGRADGATALIVLRPSCSESIADEDIMLYFLELPLVEVRVPEPLVEGYLLH